MSHLVSARDLSAEIEQDAERQVEGPVLVDVQWRLSSGRSASSGPIGRPDYDAGHLPGAFFVDLDTELAGAPGEGGRHPLPEASVVQEALRRCGVGDGSRVVVYDGRESFAAARAWWVFRWAGLTDVRVLDGGLAAWQAAGLPVSTHEPQPREGDVTVRPGSLPVLDADGAAAWARRAVLLDARDPERYSGETEPLDPVAGHVPGAVNSPTRAWVAPDGTFRRDLADHWASVGPGTVGADEVAVYCGSGVTAAHHALALAEIGVDATLYPGSWSDWVRDPERPVATGPTPG
ncbi:thiosulfate/3-mercaptopyruvate sulfurtransferase [Terracoccus luteus]|uniref:Thiosulfate/3-mercaptopyruvate sulfurtransferase n=1 Tax=Terracoccus luteus TaxID=53356 RepID=A0A495XT41_9MICO|nr:sulfurtransferase [Terracoccus luteus]RKT77691.1 thiosulfate/3-mercaptopyruvate sulfurtransferase [Terracoccus luteus]